MQNLSIFIKGTPEADYHRQQVGERGILEQIDFINNILREEGLTLDAIVEFYGILDRIETSLTKCANDPRTRRAMNAFEVPQTKKQAPVQAPVPENTPETPVPETTQSEPDPVPEVEEKPEEVNEEVNEEPITETTQSEPEPVPGVEEKPEEVNEEVNEEPIQESETEPGPKKEAE